MSQHHILIISGHRNWIFNSRSFWLSILFISSIILFIIGSLLYGYLHYYFLLNEKILTFHATQLKNEQLEQQIAKIRIEHEKQFDEMNYRYHSEFQDIRQVLRVVESLAITLKDSASREKISEQINALRRHLQKLTINSYDDSIGNDALVNIDRFRAIDNEKNIRVQFKIKAFSYEGKRVKLTVLPLMRSQLNILIKDDLPETQSIQLKKIHLIEKDFVYPKEGENFSAIRILIWDSDKEVLFEQNYPILKRKDNLLPQ